MSSFTIVVPDSVRELAENSIGIFFEGISKASPKAIVDDHLDLAKSVKRAKLLERYTPLNNKKLLEIGSGFGTNLAMWIKSYQVDGYGTEPDGVGFGASFAASRELFSANCIDCERIVQANGEMLPFLDASFDIVLSANVLEHTKNPGSYWIPGWWRSRFFSALWEPAPTRWSPCGYPERRGDANQPENRYGVARHPTLTN